MCTTYNYKVEQGVDNLEIRLKNMQLIPALAYVLELYFHFRVVTLLRVKI